MPMREQKLIDELPSESAKEMTEVNESGDKITMSEKRQFRIAHNCYQCRLYKNPKRCMAEKICPLDVLGERALRRRRRCPKDNTGDCPYGNGAGTCFGFCMREILKEQRERKRRYEQAEEDKEDDG